MSEPKKPRAVSSGLEDPPARSFWRVGKVLDAHGIRGEIFILLFAGEADWLEKLEKIWLRTKNIPSAPSATDVALSHDPTDLPDTELTVTAKKVHNRGGRTGLILRAQEISNRNEAEALKGSLFYIPDEFLQTRDPDSFYLKEILGFRVVDEHLGEIGVVENFGSNGAQDLIQVIYEERSIEIPLVDAFIECVDFDRKELRLNLPEGLLDLSEDTSS